MTPITQDRKNLLRSHFWSASRKCEEIYGRCRFSTVPNFTFLYFSRGLFSSCEKIKIGVSSTPPENAIVIYEHGAEISKKAFLKACGEQLKKVLGTPEGEAIAPLEILKKPPVCGCQEFKRRWEIENKKLPTGRKGWSKGTPPPPEPEDLPF